MTKNEQNRVVAWRLKIIRQASELPRGHDKIKRAGRVWRPAFPLGHSCTRGAQGRRKSARLERVHIARHDNLRQEVWPYRVIVGQPCDCPRHRRFECLSERNAAARRRRH